ncbi:MAG TPA: CorA family divalent cation transporter [Acholeplasmataceae bacterium]|nr:CorA family divalent cation transporter [Acholeplasmataceae bacterium]
MNLSQYIKPKSMIYTGEHKHVETSITHYEYDENHLDVTHVFDKKTNRKHYIQVVGLADVKTIDQLRETYPIDPLVLEDVFNVNQRTKFEIKNQYIFAVLNLEYLYQGEVVEEYMSLVMFKDTLITFHEKKPQFLEPLESLFADHKDLRQRGVDYLLYQILDIITDYELDIYDILDEQINLFEENSK